MAKVLRMAFSGGLGGLGAGLFCWLALGSGGALAACPADVSIQGALTCSSDLSGVVVAEDDSFLGGGCDDAACYTCGDPYANEPQVAPEAVYTFECQQAGSVTMLITDLPCDLDIYALDSSCDPYTGCLYGSTASYATDDQITFDCSPGQDYYIVVEAYGTRHLEDASGPCTDDGTADGTVYDPTYTLSFDVSASTGCAEDCDNGEDDDIDSLVDCDDTDCWSEALCCDVDGDGVLAEACEGTDCDDGDDATYPGAHEDGGAGTGAGDGVDNDCDGTTDEGTLAFDDDGDGFSEDEGDCDDSDPYTYPESTDRPDDGIDQDCDGEDATVADTGHSDDTVDSGLADGTGDISGDAGKGDRGCACGHGGAIGGLWLAIAALGWRRRR